MKTITICDKEYPIECNAFTRFEYKKIFGKGIFADLQILNKFNEKQEEVKKELEGKTEKEIESAVNSAMMEGLDDFIDVIEKIAFILIHTANSNVGSFEKWLKGINKIDLSANWITEVTELAVSSFCGQGTN